MAVIAVLTVGGLAMAANLGLLDSSVRSQQSIDATSGPVDELGAPLVTAVPSGDGSQQAFVIDGVGTVQILRSLDDHGPTLSIQDVQVQAGWKAEILSINPSGVGVEFLSARRAMDFEAFLADDGEIAARFRISPRGAPLIVTSPDGASDTVDRGEERGDDAADARADATAGTAPDGATDATAGTASDGAGSDEGRPSSTSTTVGPATGSTTPSSASTTPAAGSGDEVGDDRSTPQPTRPDEGMWIYYEDGVYVLENTLRGIDRSRPPSGLSSGEERGRAKAERARGSGRSNRHGLLDDD